MLTVGEIKAGIVLHLDPDTLEQKGALCSCSADLRVRGGHFFVCLSTSGDAALWLPLYSKEGVGRQKLPSGGRKGHAKWTKGIFYWHEAQVWTASPAAVIAAAKAGLDMSRLGSRNELAVAALPNLTVPSIGDTST